MSLLQWVLHTPRFLLAHLFDHAGLFAQWSASALDGLSEAMFDVSRSLYDVDALLGGDDDEDDDEGLAG